MDPVYNLPPEIILGMPSAVFFLLLSVLVVWSVIWKGLALWRAARNTDKSWFIFFLLVNTIGILEIIYIYFFSKKRKA